MNLLPSLILFSALVAAASAPAQSVVLDYDDSALVSPPELTFPFYNAGPGVCRWQSFVPAAFAGMPTTAMYVSRIGFQISGTETYSQFEIRAGAQSFASLDQTWATNLPDQRIQADWSNREIVGGPSVGGSRTNEWVEFELDFPFVWTPGENVVVDITSRISGQGGYLYSGRGQSIPRLVDFAYAGGAAATGAAQPSGGLKIRVVFEPLTNVIGFGAGCPGTQAQTPRLSATGAPKIGNSSFFINLSNARPSAVNALVFGITKLSVPIDFGGGCSWYTSGDLVLQGVTSTSGGDTRVLPLLVSPSLAGATLHCQWAVVDPNAGSSLGWSLSDAATVVLYQ